MSGGWIVALLLVLVATASAVAGLSFCRDGLRRRQRSAGYRCHRCGYDLRGHARRLARCPECGRIVDTTVDGRVARRGRNYRQVAAGVGMVMPLVILPGALIIEFPTPAAPAPAAVAAAPGPAIVAPRGPTIRIFAPRPATAPSAGTVQDLIRATNLAQEAAAERTGPPAPPRDPFAPSAEALPALEPGWRHRPILGAALPDLGAARWSGPGTIGAEGTSTTLAWPSYAGDAAWTPPGMTPASAGPVVNLLAPSRLDARVAPVLRTGVPTPLPVGSGPP